MFNDISKAYWTKVYVTYGTSLEEWWKEPPSQHLLNEFIDIEICNTDDLMDMGYLDHEKDNFTQKFIDEVINDI